jgi:hypothetical protein
MSDRSKELEASTSLGRQLQARSRRRREQMTTASRVANSGPRRNDLLPALTLEYVPLNELRPSAAKLRRLELVHVREVAASIARLGLCDPLLIGADNGLIDGEARFAAAEQLGLERAPCIRVGHLSLDELRVLRLAVNRLAEKGQWDLDALKIEFEQLVVVDAPIEISGFAPAEIDHILLGDEAAGLETWYGGAPTARFICASPEPTASLAHGGARAAFPFPRWSPLAMRAVSCPSRTAR